MKIIIGIYNGITTITINKTPFPASTEKGAKFRFINAQYVKQSLCQSLKEKGRMAKDPAFLFYPNDWLGGTMYLTRHQKGCYIDLLVAQFNSGPLSLETIKTVLGQDQAIWTVLSSKFKQDSNGNFFNERLATEVEKRKKYSDSRRDNISKRYKKATHEATYVAHMNLHMENRNRNESLDEDRGSGGKEKVWNQKPTTNDVGPLPVTYLRDAQQRIHLANYYSPPDEVLLQFFETWKQTNLTGMKYYHTENDVYAHFVNVAKKEKFIKPKDTEITIGPVVSNKERLKRYE